MRGRICLKSGSEEGTVLVTSLIFLVILTVLGIFATRTSQLDLQIAANEIPHKQNFYLAEAGLSREAAELGRGNYPVTKIHSPHKLADHTYSILPGADHKVFGETYDFEVTYIGFFLPFKGYDAAEYARYDYSVEVKADHLGVASRLYKIGPKAE